MEDIQSKIKNPTARDLARRISVLIENETANEILRKVKTFNAAGEQLFLLRQWCKHTDLKAEAGPVIDYAVHLALRTSEYTPTSRDFRDLCEPLPSIMDINLSGTLINSLDLHRDSARVAGPTQDYVRWQMLMAQAESTFSPVRGGQRLCEVYSEIASVEKLDIKSVCLAIIVGFSGVIDVGGGFSNSAMVKDLAMLDLKESVGKLLDLTADHYIVTRPIIEALAGRRADIALTIIEELNYEYRRDSALTDLSESLSDRPDNEIDCMSFRALIGRWADRDREEAAVAGWVARLWKISDCSILQRLSADIKFLAERAREISNPYRACISMSHAISLLRRCGGSNAELSANLAERLSGARELIAEPSMRLRTGYEMANILSAHGRELALSLLSETDREKVAYNDLSRSTFLYCLRLAARAYSGLLPQRLNTTIDLDRIGALFERVTSKSSRLVLWGELAMRMFAMECDSEAKKLVNSRIRPMLDGLKQSCPFEWSNATAFVAPALYSASPIGGCEYVAGLQMQAREEAYENILRFIVFGVPTDEPVSEKSSQGHHLAFDSCVEILRILELCDTDYLIYKYICIVAESAGWRHNKNLPTHEQKTKLSDLIRQISAKSSQIRGLSSTRDSRYWQKRRRPDW